MNPPSGVTTSPNARLTKQSRRPRESSRGWSERISLTQLALHGSENFSSSADRPAIFFSFISLRTIHFFTRLTHDTLDDRDGMMTEDDGKECDSGGCSTATWYDQWEHNGRYCKAEVASDIGCQEAAMC